MTKDPAFLFYYQDFAYGTRKMTFEEKGAYMELLCEQADSGHLSIDDIKRVLKDSFHLWKGVCKKFDKDGDNFFYNVVLEEHISKRKKFVKSRIGNLSGTHKESLMENVNVNVNVNRKRIFIKPTIEEVRVYCKERNNGIVPEKFWNFYEANGWVQGNSRKPIKSWKACINYWERSDYNKTGENKRGQEQYVHFPERKDK